MAGQAGGQMPMHGMSGHSPEDWDESQYGDSAYLNGGMEDQGQNLGAGYLKGFPGMQKKTTRDGQPAKRRGPKPDSKPAQTRRQELNRQAQRTHRERKEQYIKALEIEVSRLREVYAQDVHEKEIIIQKQQRDIALCRDMLASHGISIENELQNRNMNMQIKRDQNSLSPSQYSPATTAGYQNVNRGPSSTAGYSPMHDPGFVNGNVNGNGLGAPNHSPSITHHSSSPSGPDLTEVAIKQEHSGVSDMPGIFEQNPQLGIDFILQLEHTCRDHEEYLVRRSVTSPDDPDEALFSGHALMASCPPASFIHNTPAQQGGLVNTYEHKVPDVAYSQLQRILDLGQRVISLEDVPSGQVTPTLALQYLRGHRHYSTLTRDDIMRMMDSMRGQVRCYGFGAVMEDFELRDALSRIFATKPETYEDLGTDYGAEVEEMYS